MSPAIKSFGVFAGSLDGRFTSPQQALVRSVWGSDPAIK
jgi:hypothetical protein